MNYVILTRESHNCARTAFVQADSEAGSKLIIERTLPSVVSTERQY